MERSTAVSRLNKGSILSFRFYRIIILLGVLIVIAGMTYWENWSVTQWKKPLEVVIYPINGESADDTQSYAETQDFVDEMTASHFQEISRFLDQQSERYFIKKLPSSVVRLGPQVKELPPEVQQGARSALDNMLWSLKLRYFAFHNTSFLDSLGKVRLFVVYHKGEDGVPLEHSLGLQKGLFGVVHVFAQAKQEKQNNVVITHELLHALGATDKYDENQMPIYPEGFGESEGGPSYPQHVAEIMAGRIAISPVRAIIPESLAACVIGYKSAHEINW